MLMFGRVRVPAAPPVVVRREVRMRVLVLVASKHGGTMEIGEAVAAALSSLGASAVVSGVTGVVDLDRYDAVVLGSAVYLGRWLPEASRFAADHLGRLKEMPVWLFSSGPLGEPAVPAGDPTEVVELASALGARGLRTFAGRLETVGLGPGHRGIAAMLHAPAGDFRRWDEIEAWARQIGVALTRVDPAADASPHGHRVQ
jgi:menaquinone-dependent protoporphyrinogen oxidase